jgi:hypothetical protein
VLDGVVSGIRMMGERRTGMFFGNGKKWKVLNKGVLASGRKSPVFLSGVSASEKSVLHSGVLAS